MEKHGKNTDNRKKFGEKIRRLHGIWLAVNMVLSQREGIYTMEARHMKNESRTDDMVDDLGKIKKAKKRKSPERQQLEKAFVQLYDEFIHPTREYSEHEVDSQLGQLYYMLMKLNSGWAEGMAKCYRRNGYLADGEEANATGNAYLLDILRKDRATGLYSTYPVNHYLNIAHHKAMDHYFRTFKMAYVSLDEQISEQDRRTVVELVPSNDPPMDDWSKEDRAKRADAIARRFIEELMSYTGAEPHKAIALMYGTVLFQLAKDSPEEDELFLLAKRSTKSSSADWAHLCMAQKTLGELAQEAEQIVQSYFATKELHWGDVFHQKLQRERDMVYTDLYSTQKTTRWIESISKSTREKLIRNFHDLDLAEYAVETLGYENSFAQRLLQKMQLKH